MAWSSLDSLWLLGLVGDHYLTFTAWKRRFFSLWYPKTQTDSLQTDGSIPEFSLLQFCSRAGFSGITKSRICSLGGGCTVWNKGTGRYYGGQLGGSLFIWGFALASTNWKDWNRINPPVTLPPFKNKKAPLFHILVDLMQGWWDVEQWELNLYPTSTTNRCATSAAALILPQPPFS